MHRRTSDHRTNGATSTVKKRRRKARQRNHSTRNPSRHHPTLTNTDQQAQQEFARIIHPTSITTFLSDYHEKKPLLHKHPHDYFSHLFSVDEFRDLVQSKRLQFGVDVDMTRYTDGKKQTMNKEGKRADGNSWKRFEEDGCSLRLLRPQEYNDDLWQVISRLESFYECMWGANLYLTPGNSQGFAPHYDDIDAFVVQLHGRKLWKLYKHREDGYDVLPRYSSVDFEEKDLPEVLMEVMLEQGDMLYIPRGVIHQAQCVDGFASLHCTLSTGQKWTWADLLLENVKVAIESAAVQDKFLRQTLPLRFGDYVGTAPRSVDKKRRQKFINNVESALDRVKSFFPLDAAADTMISRFMHKKLPPRIEHAYDCKQTTDIGRESEIRLVAGGIAKTVAPREIGKGSSLIHCLANQRALQDRPNKMAWLEENENECANQEEEEAVNYVIRAYPNPVKVADIPLEINEDRVTLAEFLVHDLKICRTL